jgi:hypothetical protein
MHAHLYTPTIITARQIPPPPPNGASLGRVTRMAVIDAIIDAFPIIKAIVLIAFEALGSVAAHTIPVQIIAFCITFLRIHVVSTNTKSE